MGEQGGGHQQRDLLAIEHRLEHRAHRHFGLAVTDVTADQAIHRLALLHVGDHVVDRLLLIDGLFEFEVGLELTEVAVGRVEREARVRLALGVELPRRQAAAGRCSIGR